MLPVIWAASPFSALLKAVLAMPREHERQKLLSTPLIGLLLFSALYILGHVRGWMTIVRGLRHSDQQ
jgi:hypothetical protein